VLGQLMTVLGTHHVSIAQVVQDGGSPAGSGGRGGATAASAARANDPVWVVVLTHEAREGDLRTALAEIDRLSVVRDKTRVIRIAAS
jgi:homoserine dehydrogenase